MLYPISHLPDIPMSFENSFVYKLLYVCTCTYAHIYRNTVGFQPEIATKVVPSRLTWGNRLKFFQEMKIITEVHWKLCLLSSNKIQQLELI